MDSGDSRAIAFGRRDSRAAWCRGCRARDQVRIAMRETEPKKPDLALFRSVQLHMEFGLLMIVAFLAAAFMHW